MKKEAIIKIISEELKTTNFTIEEVVQGIMTLVYKIVTPQENYYFRATKDKDKSFQTFQHIYESLRKSGAVVPKIIAAQDTDSEYSWMITTEVTGKSFREIKESFSPETRENILKDALKTVSAFWKYEAEGFGYSNKLMLKNNKINAPFQHNFDFLTHNAKQNIRILIVKKYLPKFAEQIVTKFQKLKPYLDSDISIFCHGDLSDKHIIVDNGVFSGIIDLDEYRCSSKYYDVAYLYSYLTPEEQDFIIEEMQELLSNEQNTKEKILVTNFFIALEDVVYMIDELKLDIPTHQHVLSMQNNLKTILALAS